MVLLSLSQENNKENIKCFSNLIYLFDKLSLHPLKKNVKYLPAKNCSPWELFMERKMSPLIAQLNGPI